MNKQFAALVGAMLVVGLSSSASHGQGNVDQPKAAERKSHVLTNSIGMKLAPIPAGEFFMGSAADADDARDDEKPRHRVRITRPFHLGIYEVTQGEFHEVMGKNPSFFSAGGPGKAKVAGLEADRFPAEQITWHDAAEFCRRLSERPEERLAGHRYRLPTEAEWEYACRGGTKTHFHFGNSLAASQANFNGKNPFGRGEKGPFLARTTSVGSYPPNAFGLYDMHGNVWEWCADWYGADYYRQSPKNDPTGPASGSSRVIRGGDWYGDARDCRSAFRNAEIPKGVFYVMGFRVAMVAAADDAAVAGEKVEAPAVPPEAGAGSAATSAAADDQVAGGEDWPRWRGTRGDGTWQGPKLPDRWPDAGLRTLWKQPVGGGYAGVIAIGGRVYTQDRVQEPAEAERVLCFDARTGEPLWNYTYPVTYGNLSYGNGPRATPLFLDDRIYALGALGNLVCLEAQSGKLLWSKDLVRDFKGRLPGWGYSASPLAFENLVVVTAGAAPDGGLIAFDRQTGDEVWRNLPDEAGYATPILAEVRGATQLVCWTPANVRGLDPRKGTLLWTVPFEVTYGTSIATPIFQEDTVVVCNYWEGSLAIRLGPAAADAQKAWDDSRNLRGLMSQPLYRDGHVWLLDKRHGLTCFELASGKKLWDDANRMTPKGRNPQATLVWTGDGNRALALNSDGELVLLRLSPEGYQEDSRTRIIGETWAHPAYAGTCVYARSDSELVCVSLVEGNAK